MVVMITIVSDSSAHLLVRENFEELMMEPLS